MVAAREPWLLLVANTSMGMDLAAAVSARVDLPLVAYANEVTLDGNSLVVTSQLYGGKVYAESAGEYTKKGVCHAVGGVEDGADEGK